MTGSRDGTVNLWDTQTGEVTATLTGPTPGIEEAAIDPSGRWLAAVGADGLWRWDLDGRQRRASWSIARPDPSGPSRSPPTASDSPLQPRTALFSSTTRPRGSARRAFTADVDFLSVTFTPDGKRLLAGTGEGRLFSWDVARMRTSVRRGCHGTNDVWELVVDPAGQRVATASSDGTARVWSLESGALVASPFMNPDGVVQPQPAGVVLRWRFLDRGRRRRPGPRVGSGEAGRGGRNDNRTR